MKYIIIGLIRVYQMIPGPWHKQCRHIPTCSEYAKEAIIEYGVFKGCYMSIKRILKCNPFGTYGYYPVIKKEKKMKKFRIFLVIITALMLTTGCIKRDNMEGITIYTSSYPFEYLVKTLYGNNADIKSIYPNGVNINVYSLSDTQLEDYGKSDLFIFNGLSKEKDYIAPMFKSNKNLKIIDASSNIEYNDRVEELWLDPSNFLMIAQNIKQGFKEYVTNEYLQSEINDKYEELKISLSMLDAKIQLLGEEATNNIIVTSDNILNYLTKYGINVISLDSDNINLDKNYEDVKEIISSGSLKYIYVIKNEDVNDNLTSLIKDTNIEFLSIDTISNLDDVQVSVGDTYYTIMNDNIEKLKLQLVQ